MFPLLPLLLHLLCAEAVNVQESFAEAGLVKDLKILAPENQLEVSYPGPFPFAPGDSLAVSEAREIPSIRLEQASKDKLYTVGRFTSSVISHQLIVPQPWSTQMHHPGRTLGQPSGSTGYSQMLTVRKRRRKTTVYHLHFQVNAYSLGKTWQEKKLQHMQDPHHQKGKRQ